MQEFRKHQQQLVHRVKPMKESCFRPKTFFEKTSVRDTFLEISKNRSKNLPFEIPLGKLICFDIKQIKRSGVSETKTGWHILIRLWCYNSFEYLFVNLNHSWIFLSFRWCIFSLCLFLFLIWPFCFNLIFKEQHQIILFDLSIISLRWVVPPRMKWHFLYFK